MPWRGAASHAQANFLPRARRCTTKLPTSGLSLGSFWQGALFALLTGVAAACGPVIERAPFTVRPDSLRPGDMLGPFDGTVVDAETDRPIAAATVAAAWAFERGIGLHGPAATREIAVETAADGRYVIPSLDDLPTGGSMRLRRFTLTVYRRGYVGYRSDFKFVTGEARHDFSQHGNKARLGKWLPTMEHRQHLVFLGSGEAITKAAGWEAQPASLEYEGVTASHALEAQPDGLGRISEEMLDVTPLLSEAEVRGVTGFAGDFEVGRLLDRIRSDVYDSRHFKAKGKSEAFDVGLRVWVGTPAVAESQFNQLKQELPAAVVTEEIGDQSVRARGGEVLGLAFLLREKGLVAQISCGTSQCTEPAMVLRLAKLVESHAGELKIPKGGKANASPGEPAAAHPKESP